VNGKERRKGGKKGEVKKKIGGGGGVKHTSFTTTITPSTSLYIHALTTQSNTTTIPFWIGHMHDG
jgi:hypothetical protein